MSETDGIYVDASRCFALFKRLSTKNQRKVSRQALKAAGNKIKAQTVKNLQQVVGHSVRKTTTYTKASGKTVNHSLAKGVRVSVQSPEEAKVHILGDYRLPWLEMNTQTRKTSGRRGKGRKIPMRRSSNRGRAVKTDSRIRWFDKAVKAKEQEAVHDIEQELMKFILKQANREGLTSY